MTATPSSRVPNFCADPKRPTAKRATYPRRLKPVVTATGAFHRPAANRSMPMDKDCVSRRAMGCLGPPGCRRMQLPPLRPLCMPLARDVRPSRWIATRATNARCPKVARITPSAMCSGGWGRQYQGAQDRVLGVVHGGFLRRAGGQAKARGRDVGRTNHPDVRPSVCEDLADACVGPLQQCQ